MIEVSRAMDVVYMGISKAFDKVPNDWLIQKIMSDGVH